MKYIIDANNLAGKLGILGEKGFDKLLIEEIKKLNRKKSRKYVLVFDSLDPMGDKYMDEGVVVIYTPRDDFYIGADDKVMELLSSRDDDFVLITDDLELIKRVEQMEIREDFVVTKIRASDFAKRIFCDDNFETDKKFLLEKDEVDEINTELLGYWK